MTDIEDTDIADEQRFRDESDLLIREIKRAYETWDALDHTQPLLELTGSRAADVALILTSNRYIDVMQALAGVHGRKHGCGYCWRASGATDAAWDALPKLPPDEAHAHAQACSHNPLVIEGNRLRILHAQTRGLLEQATANRDKIATERDYLIERHALAVLHLREADAALAAIKTGSAP